MTNEASGHGSGGLAGGLSTGMKMAAVALLVHELMKHARADQPQASSPGAPSGGSTTGGGLGGLLGGLFGGGGGAGSADSGGLGGLLSGSVLGGLGGLLSHLQNKGMGPQVNSWVSSGPNHPVSPQQLESAFDPQELDEAARQTGTDRGSLMQELSRLLPQVVDRLTPQGRLPASEEKPDPASLQEVLTGQGGAAPSPTGKTGPRYGGEKDPI